MNSVHQAIKSSKKNRLCEEKPSGTDDDEQELAEIWEKG